jgi:hypothetical protein
MPKKDKTKNIKKSAFTKRRGIWLMIIGIAMQFLNIITYGLWQIDIDVIGLFIFIIGLVITIMKWKKE